MTAAHTRLSRPRYDDERASAARKEYDVVETNNEQQGNIEAALNQRIVQDYLQHFGNDRL